MKEAASEASDDESGGSIRVQMNRLAWSGVNKFRLSSLVSSRELPEAVSELSGSGVYYPDTP